MDSKRGRGTYAFASGTLDRASELREDEATLRVRFETARILRITPDGCVPLAADRLVAVKRAELDSELAFERASFLGQCGGEAWFAWPMASGDAQQAAVTDQFIHLRRAAGLLPEDELALCAYARALLHWQSRKRYCGRCGAAAIFDQAGHRARCSDASCAQQYFPRTDPAIIVLVSHSDRCLLGRQASWPQGRFSTLAGFVEPGETLEQAVAREVAEESGVRIADARYVASQPWPFPAALMLGFEAEAASDAITVGAELSEARWFTPAELARGSLNGELKLSPALSIAFHLVDRWYHRQTGSHLTPGPE